MEQSANYNGIDLSLIENDANFSSEDINKIKFRVAESINQNYNIDNEESNSILPKYIKENKLFSLALCTDIHDDNVAPLGDLEVHTQEYQLIDDILNLMMGCNGVYIQTDVEENFGSKKFRFNIDNSVEPFLKSLVLRIVPICEYYFNVVNFVESKSEYEEGKVNHALTAAINNLIKDYMVMVCQLEDQHLKYKLTLQKIWFGIEKSAEVLELLYSVTSDIIKKKCTGGAVLSLLYNKSMHLSGCGYLEDIAVYLTEASAIPYMKMINLWIYKGVIEDPYREFMVVDNEQELDSQSLCSSEVSDEQFDDYWENRYLCDDKNVPHFFSTLSNDIVKTGKYINVIRQSERYLCDDKNVPHFFSTLSNDIVKTGKYINVIRQSERYLCDDKNMPCFFFSTLSNDIVKTGKYINVIRQSDKNYQFPDCEKIVFKVRDNSYIELIEKCRKFASKKLLKLLVEDKHLIDHLKCIKHFFLLGQGDLVSQILLLCEDELNKTVGDVIVLSLASLLEVALRTSSANSLTYKDNLKCALLPYSIMGQMMRILSIDTFEEPEYKNLQDGSLDLLGVEGYALSYHVEWPLLLVIDRKSHLCYQIIFRQLFICKHVERMLGKVWTNNKTSRQFSASTACGYRKCLLLTQRMICFIQDFQYYMYFEVIEKNWNALMQNVTQLDTTDEVIESHTEFVNSCMKDCLLTSPQLLKIIMKIIKISLDFSNFILNQTTEYYPNYDRVACENFDETVARYDIQYTGMIVTLLNRISDDGREKYNDAFINSLQRLDYNYYSSKCDLMKMCNSSDRSVSGST